MKEEAFVTCLTCGHTSLSFVLVDEHGGLSGTARCPKCSKTAYTNNLAGLWCYMRASAKKVAALNLDLMDLQSQGDS